MTTATFPARRARIATFLVSLTLVHAGDALGRDARIEDQVRRLKAMHQEILLGGACRRIDAIHALARRRPRQIVQAFRNHPPRDASEALGPQGRSGVPFGLAATRASGPLPSNVRVSGPSQFSATQSEVTIAAEGAYRVAAWNDGGTTGGNPNGISYATSTDAGATWGPSVRLPVTGAVLVWTSDPVIVTDARRGAFVLAALVIAEGPRNGVGVIRGRFATNGFAWEAPQVARATRDTFPDKTWLAADSLSWNLYLSYTTFYRRQMKNTDQIELQRSVDGGLAWEPQVKLSPDSEDGLVQGSRPIVGPEGDVHVVWKTIDT